MKSIVTGSGRPCPKCHRPMERCKHPTNWCPPTDRYYFQEWDVCRSCRHVQHYNEFRREPAPDTNPQAELLDHAHYQDDWISQVLGIPSISELRLQEFHVKQLHNGDQQAEPKVTDGSQATLCVSRSARGVQTSVDAVA